MFPSSERAVVLAVWQPERSWVRLTWENRADGVLEGVGADGSTCVLGRILQPLAGVGRYDGTPSAGHGKTTSVQPGSWVVSTVERALDYRAGVGKERRGGFRIQAVDGRVAPRQSDATLLFAPIAPPDRNDAARNARAAPDWDQVCFWAEDARWECRIDDSSWMPLPIATGPRIAAFTGDDWAAAPYRLGGRPIQKGITALRVHLPARSPEKIRQCVDDLVRQDRVRRAIEARLRGTPVVQGRYVVRVRPTDPSRARFVRLSVDGRVVAFSNVAPFDLPWDTTRVADGEYTLVVEILDNSGAAIATTTRS
ncbi:MAG: Ig-like domain-containing protein, partial [Armatimonadaceae bacterium]